MKEFFEKLYMKVSGGEDAVLCNIIYSSGSAPRKEGSKMAVFKDGSITGTIGGGIVEYCAIQEAMTLFDNKDMIIRDYILNASDVSGLGAVCGGEIKVSFIFIDHKKERDAKFLLELRERFSREENVWLLTHLDGEKKGEMEILTKKDENNSIYGIYLDSKTHLTEKFFTELIISSGLVYIFGGGHISKALVPVISKIGFRPVILEDRDEFLDISLFKGAVDTVKVDFRHPEVKISVKDTDYIIIMTRGHEADFEVLEFALKTSASYIGLIGSRSKWEHTVRRLEKDGFERKDYDRIHNPIGLPIGAETPDEIAISIAAQLIMHRSSH